MHGERKVMMVAGDLGRWYEPPLEGRGFVTTDFHGDIRAYSLVENLFRERDDIQWWIDLGDKGDSEKRQKEDAGIPVDGDLQIYQKIHILRRDIAKGRLAGKQFIEIVGNHDVLDLEIYELLKKHHLLSQRHRFSLSTLLEKVAVKERWTETRASQIDLYRHRYESWIKRLCLEDPGLSELEAGVRFLIRVVFCQHGFAMRMSKREHEMMTRVETLAIHLQKAKIVLSHGGIPPHPAEPWELAEAPEEVRRGYFWNRYPDDYSVNHLKAFLHRADASLLIVGHTPPKAIIDRDPDRTIIDRGVALTNSLQLTFTSGFSGGQGNRVFLELDASKVCNGLSDIDIHVLP